MHITVSVATPAKTSGPAVLTVSRCLQHIIDHALAVGESRYPRVNQFKWPGGLGRQAKSGP